MSDFDRCLKCGEYGWHPCKCRMIGRVWHPDRGHTEDDARELWSKHDTSDAIERYMVQWDANQGYDSSEEQGLAFRPDDGGPVQYFVSLRELQPVYRVSEADDHERARLRREQAKTIKRDRAYARRKKQQKAA